MRKRRTAAELVAALNADPTFVALREDQEQARLERVAELRRAEAPLVDELQAAGCPVESAWELVPQDSRKRAKAPFPQALPILLEHLSRPYPGPVLEGIARSLAVPEAKFAWSDLVNQYRNEQDSRARTGLADALSTIADADLVEDVIELAKDPKLGSSRLLLLSALERSKDPQAHRTLRELAGDPQLEKEIDIILGRIQKRGGRMENEPTE